MDIKSVHKIYFLGIGGIGMSALARYFLWIGKQVAGYDRVCTPLTLELESEGMTVHYKDNPELIPGDIDLIVYTPAIPATDREFQKLKSSGLPMLKRAEVLGLISREVPTIAVAGTHGKTTVTTMLAHILKTAGTKFSAFMGGISSNYNTNFLASASPEWIVAEADEFDRSFLHLHPRIAVVTSMEADHLDIYQNLQNMEESFKGFVGNIQKGGTLVAQHSLKSLLEVASEGISYGLGGQGKFRADNIRIAEGLYIWDIPGEIYNLTLGMPGLHNVENAIAAYTAARLAGVKKEEIKNALKSYKGVHRRFDVKVQNEKLVYIDDYAHHPGEITALVTSVKELYPGKKLTGIFQPHLFTRTRDFADGFAQSLSLLDEVVLLNIYPARELAIPGIDSQFLLNKIQHNNKKLISDDELLGFVEKGRFEVLLTIGAGNIDRFVEPITDILKKW